MTLCESIETYFSLSYCHSQVAALNLLGVAAPDEILASETTTGRSSPASYQSSSSAGLDTPRSSVYCRVGALTVHRLGHIYSKYVILISLVAMSWVFVVGSSDPQVMSLIHFCSSSVC